MISETVFSFGSDLGFYSLILFALFWLIIAVLRLVVVLQDLIHHSTYHLKH